MQIVHVVVVHDPRNCTSMFGRRPDEPYSLGVLAEDAAALTDYLNMAKAMLAGHAFGGRIAQTLWADNPGREQVVILYETGGYLPPYPIDNGPIRAANKDACATREEMFLVADTGKIPKHVVRKALAACAVKFFGHNHGVTIPNLSFAAKLPWQHSLRIAGRKYPKTSRPFSFRAHVTNSAPGRCQRPRKQAAQQPAGLFRRAGPYGNS